MQVQNTDFQDQLVRGLAHRMNNILTLFHGYLGLVLDNQKLDDDARAGLLKVKEGAKAASDLMDRTHSLVRPSTTVWRDLDLCDMLQTLKPLLQSFCAPGVTLEINAPADLPHVYGDLNRLKTAVVELVRNAADATPEGGKITIDVSADASTGGITAAEQPIRWLTISITDTGIGIADEAMPKVFTPFFTTKKKKQSAGLGLTLTQQFIQQHQGHITIDSRPGQGAKATIRLPAHAEVLAMAV